VRKWQNQTWIITERKVQKVNHNSWKTLAFSQNAIIRTRFAFGPEQLFMEMSQWNTLCSYLKLTKLSFFFQKRRRQNRSCLGGWYQWKGGGHLERVKEGEYYVLMNENGKNETCWNSSGMGVREDKGKWWRGWIKLWYIIGTFVNVTMYLQCNNKKNLNKIYETRF
jgi:hypothetical protein